MAGTRFYAQIDVSITGEAETPEDGLLGFYATSEGFYKVDSAGVSQRLLTTGDIGTTIPGTQQQYTTTTTTTKGYYRVGTIPIGSNFKFGMFKVKATTTTGTTTESVITVNLAYKAGDYGSQTSAIVANTSHSFNSQSGSDNGYVLLYCRLSFDGTSGYIDLYKLAPGVVTIVIEPLTTSDWVWATGALTANPVVGSYRNVTCYLYAGTTGSNLRANSASSASYCNYGVLGSQTISNATNKTGQWEYFGNVYMAYNASYLVGRSINIRVRMQELTYDGSTALAALDDFIIVIKVSLATHTDATTFNTTVPQIRIEIEGQTSLAPEDIVGSVYQTSTSTKYIRFYIKLKGANTVYMINPEQRYGRVFANTSFGMDTDCYFSYAGNQTPLAALPAPVQGSNVSAILRSVTASGFYTPNLIINQPWGYHGIAAIINPFTSALIAGYDPGGAFWYANEGFSYNPIDTYFDVNGYIRSTSLVGEGNVPLMVSADGEIFRGNPTTAGVTSFNTRTGDVSLLRSDIDNVMTLQKLTLMGNPSDKAGTWQEIGIGAGLGINYGSLVCTLKPGLEYIKIADSYSREIILDGNDRRGILFKNGQNTSATISDNGDGYIHVTYNASATGASIVAYELALANIFTIPSGSWQNVTGLTQILIPTGYKYLIIIHATIGRNTNVTASNIALRLIEGLSGTVICSTENYVPATSTTTYRFNLSMTGYIDLTGKASTNLTLQVYSTTNGWSLYSALQSPMTSSKATVITAIQL